MKKILLYLFILAACHAQGQKRQLVTKNFRFADGVYLSLQELQANRPTYRWEDVEVVHFTNPQTSLTQVEQIMMKKDSQAIDLGSAWALVMDGIPSIRIPQGEIKKDLPAFAALKLRGKICYFTYPDWRTKKLYVAAYNPLTGRPFRQGHVEREEEIIVEKMLHFETGAMADLTVDNFLKWIADDEPLLSTYLELPPDERKEKLFKGLLIYADRNETFIKE